jgi:hypothetical protein
LQHQERRNVIANLAQDGELGTSWSYFELIHACRVAGANKRLQLESALENSANRPLSLAKTQSKPPLHDMEMELSLAKTLSYAAGAGRGD